MSSTRTHAASHRPIGRLAAASLVALLLAVQGLGLWHRTVHAPTPPGAHAAWHVHPASEAPQAVAEPGDTEHASAASAFGHSPSDADQCRLYDQLTLADTLHVALVAVPALAPRPVHVVVVATATVRPSGAPYEARAPPVLA